MIVTAVIVTALAFFVVLLATVKPLGGYLDDVFAGRRTFATPVGLPLENAVYRLCRIDPRNEMSWQTYAFALLAMSVASVAFVYGILRLQAALPLDPQHFARLAPDLAWNTAVSFATTTDWQFYAGENALSYFSQMAGLAWQTFIAAALGLTVAIAPARSLACEKTSVIGNFWVDLTRDTLYVLLPLSIVFAWRSSGRANRRTSRRTAP